VREDASRMLLCFVLLILSPRCVGLAGLISVTSSELCCLFESKSQCVSVYAAVHEGRATGVTTYFNMEERVVAVLYLRQG